MHCNFLWQQSQSFPCIRVQTPLPVAVPKGPSSFLGLHFQCSSCRPLCSLFMQPASLQVTCLDSIGKRCDFVRDAVWELALPNVDTLWSRAEVAAQLPKHREVRPFQLC